MSSTMTTINTYSVLFEKESFETDMMNNLKFLFELSRKERMSDYDIYDYSFWKNIFPEKYVASLIPQSSFFSEFVEQESILPNYFIEGGRLLSSVSHLERNMISHDFYYSQYNTLEHNIGKYLNLTYNKHYKSKIRQWAQEKYEFHPDKE